MINLLFWLSKKFNFIDKVISKIATMYAESKRKEEEKNIPFTIEMAEKLAQEDLKKIVAYEKNGEASGYNKPVIVRARRR